MELTLNRFQATDQATLGELRIDGAHECFTLEDPLAWLDQDQTRKAIPPGRYQVTIDQSSRFGRLMPHVLNVPGRSGIRIHSGNTAEDTAGCVLLGRYYRTDWVGESDAAFASFYPKLQAALQGGEQVWVNVTETPDPAPGAISSPTPATA